MDLFWRFLGWVKFKYYGVDRNYGDDIWITTSANAYVRIVHIRHRVLWAITAGFQRLYAFVGFVVLRR
jgi:hypothetical protein